VADQGVNDRDAEDNQGIDPVPHHRRQRRRGQQDENQHIVKVGEETQPGRLAFLFRQRVRAKGGQALRGFGGA
jgi:hypothetical protein